MFLSELIRVSGNGDILDSAYEHILGHKPEGQTIHLITAKKIAAGIGMDSQLKLENPVTGQRRYWYWVLMNLQDIQRWSKEQIADWLAGQEADYVEPESEHSAAVLSKIAERRYIVDNT